MVIKDEFLYNTVVMLMPKVFDFFHQGESER